MKPPLLTPHPRPRPVWYPSYRQVGFVRPNASSSTHELNGLDEATWSLEYEKGVTEQWARITLASVLVLWLPAWLSWCYVVFYHKSGGAGFKVRRQWRGFGCVTEFFSSSVCCVELSTREFMRRTPGRCRGCLKKNLNAPRPSDHPPVRGNASLPGEVYLSM